ncbi:MAG: CpaF family protein [Actinobacteria bacterium]|nr:CpaF family protein [Actinomycetota bacterium]
MVTRPDPALVADLRARVAERLSARHHDDLAAGRSRLSGEDERAFAHDLIQRALDEHAAEALGPRARRLDAQEEQALGEAVFAAIFGFGAFERHLHDPKVTDIHAQGCDRVFVVYDDGTKAQVDPVAESDEAMVETVRAVLADGRTERRWDPSSPVVHFRLADGSRLCAVMSVAERPSVAIRRHRHPVVFLPDLVALGAMDQRLAAFLAALVRARKNVIVAGGTSVGKTTLLRALVNEIPSHERLVTVEDSAELGAEAYPELHPDVVTLETRDPNVEGTGEVTMAELTKLALRLDPDRVIVGEVRGAEVVHMLDAMTQGNDGSMCTLHARSSQAVFKKLAMYAGRSPERWSIEDTYRVVDLAVDFVVHLGRDHHHDEGRRGTRYATSVREVLEADGPLIASNEVFRPGADGRAVPGAPLRSSTLEDLVTAGLDPDVLLAGGEPR